MASAHCCAGPTDRRHTTPCRACRGTASSPDCSTANAPASSAFHRISRCAGAGRLPDVTVLIPKAPFQRIVEQHGATVLRVCSAVVGPNDAQDAWSETFLSALRAYPDLETGANVQAWLVTIAHRKAIDITRARARAAIPVGELPERISTVGVPVSD